MNKRGIHWQEIATVMLVLVVVFFVIIAFNKESRAEFFQLVGIREKLAKIELPDLGLATPTEIARAERTPEGRIELLKKMLKEADDAFGRKDYALAKTKYEEFLNRCNGDLKSECSPDLKGKAEKGLEESKFRSIASMLSEKEKLDAYNSWVTSYPKTRFLAEAYFEIGKLYAGGSFYDAAKALEYYELARTKVGEGYGGVSLVDIDRTISDLSKSRGEPKDVQTNIKLFKDAWALAEDFFSRGNNKDAVSEITKAASYLDRELIPLNTDDMVKFRLAQIKIYMAVDDFVKAFGAYNKLKAANIAQDKLKSAKQILGDDYYGSLSLGASGDIIRLYGETGIIIKSSDGSTVTFCIAYKGKEIENSCTELGVTTNYEVLSKYPFVSIRFKSIGKSGENSAFNFKLLWFDGKKSEEFELVEGGKTERILPSFPLEVQYDGNELLFSDAVGEWTDLCGTSNDDGDSTDVNWPYTSGPLDDPRYICDNMPSVEVYHRGYKIKEKSFWGDTEAVTVKFVYTP